MYPSTTPVSLRIQRWLDNVLVEVVEFIGVPRDWQTLQKPPKEPQPQMKSTCLHEACTLSFRTLVICLRHHHHILYQRNSQRIYLRAHVIGILSLFVDYVDSVFVRSAGQSKPSTSIEVLFLRYMQNPSPAAYSV